MSNGEGERTHCDLHISRIEPLFRVMHESGPLFVYPAPCLGSRPYRRVKRGRALVRLKRQPCREIWPPIIRPSRRQSLAFPLCAFLTASKCVESTSVHKAIVQPRSLSLSMKPTNGIPFRVDPYDRRYECFAAGFSPRDAKGCGPTPAHHSFPPSSHHAEMPM